MLETNNLPAAVQAIVERYWERLLDAEQGGAGQVGIEEQKLSALVAADPVFAGPVEAGKVDPYESLVGID